MPLLINRQLVENDAWQLIEEDQSIPADGQLILPLPRYLENQEALAGRELAVQINGDDNIDAVIENIAQFPLIVVAVPAFTDGRGFSFARILRRKGYQGEIRATGDVTRDRLEFLSRCGFNAFDIPADRYSDDILSAFEEMSVHYQGSSDDPRPIFRR